MFVHRATTACPSCNKQEEVWFYNSKITPTSSIECSRCSQIYEASEFLTGLLMLRSNATISTLHPE